MNTKINIKEEDVASQNNTEFFAKDVEMKTNCDAVFLTNYCNLTVKTEIKSEPTFPDFCLQEKRELLTEHLEKQIKPEMVICSSNIEIDIKTEPEEQTLVSEFGSHSESGFLLEDPEIKVKKYNNDREMHDKVQIKEECLWLETPTSSAFDNNKDVDFPSLKSARLYKEAVLGVNGDKSALHSDEGSGEDSSFCNGKEHHECESQESNITKVSSIEKYVWPQQSDTHSTAEKICSKALYLKQKSVKHKNKRAYRCSICESSFNSLSNLKRHTLRHIGEKAHKSEIWESFSHSLHLKKRTSSHAVEKPRKCEMCEKSFIYSSDLKRHTLSHTGERSQKCEICGKRFIYMSDLKRHTLSHTDKKPHKCKMCEKSFIQLSDLKRHTLSHTGEKPHKCNICDRRFIQLSHFKKHVLSHTSEKPKSGNL